MKKIINRNSYLAGALFAVISEVLCAALIFIVTIIVGRYDMRWFAAAFVPPLLLLRYYAKEKSYPCTLKAVITTFFITFVAFMWFMLKYKYISF